jgi:hypothetical protein
MTARLHLGHGPEHTTASHGSLAHIGPSKAGIPEVAFRKAIKPFPPHKPPARSKTKNQERRTKNEEKNTRTEFGEFPVCPPSRLRGVLMFLPRVPAAWNYSVV